MRDDDAIKTEGNVSFYEAASTVIVVETPLAKVKLCRIQFGKDGSIMVPFPYMNAKRGMLSEITHQPPPEGPFTYDLASGGVVAEYDVKFNHHRSGIAQFSKSGSGDLLPRRTSFPLESGGMVFMCLAHWLSGLEWVSPPKKKDLCLRFAFADEHPIGVRLQAFWRSKSDISWGGRPIGVQVGPRSDAVDRRTGHQQRFAFLGQPEGFALRDHLLMLSIEAVPAPSGGDTPSMVFVGGLDPHERTRERPDPQSAGFLAFLFPYNGIGGRMPEKKLG